MALKIAILALIFEIITIISRALFGPITKYYDRIKFKYKVRIHHGYCGIVMALIGWFYPSELLVIFGMALVISDLLHHLVVIPIWLKNKN